MEGGRFSGPGFHAELVPVIPEVEFRFERLKITVQGEAAARMVYLDGLVAGTRKKGVQGLNLGKDWRILIPHVLQIGNPLHGRVVVIDSEFAAAPQPGFRVLESDCLPDKALCAMVVCSVTCQSLSQPDKARPPN